MFSVFEKLFKNNSGMAVLPVVLMIGGLIVEIAIASVLMSYFLGSSGLGVKISEDALAAAWSGAEDAILKIVRNKDYVGVYSLDINFHKADVSVAETLNPEEKVVYSTGKALNKIRKIEALIEVDNYTGEVKTKTFKEITY